MVEAVMIWNEPNNLSYWDAGLDRDWSLYARMAILASDAIAAESPKMPRVLGGIWPIDPLFVSRMERLGVLAKVEAVAIHGFPLDWNHWMIHEWPEKLRSMRAVTDLPIWISEVGASSFGAEEVQAFGLKRTAELLVGRVPRIHWFSLFDLPKSWPATARHRETEGSAYYRHFYMGLIREDGKPKIALRHFADYTPQLGICQWLSFEDHRLDATVRWCKELGVKYLRTGLSWSDWFRPGAEAWFDRMMTAFDPFEVTLTCCFTPEHLGLRPYCASPPMNPSQFADFCGAMCRRYTHG